MSLILFINNLAQKKLRNYLATNNQKIPNQLGRSTDRPTFKWASYIMRNITSVRMMVQDKVYRTIEGLNSAQEIIIRAFGDIAVEIYGMTP